MGLVLGALRVLLVVLAMTLVLLVVLGMLLVVLRMLLIAIEEMASHYCAYSKKTTPGSPRSLPGPQTPPAGLPRYLAIRAPPKIIEGLRVFSFEFRLHVLRLGRSW